MHPPCLGDRPPEADRPYECRASLRAEALEAEGSSTTIIILCSVGAVPLQPTPNINTVKVVVYQKNLTTRGTELYEK